MLSLEVDFLLLLFLGSSLRLSFLLADNREQVCGDSMLFQFNVICAFIKDAPLRRDHGCGDSLYFNVNFHLHKFGVSRKITHPTAHDLRINCIRLARCDVDARSSNSVEALAAAVDELRRC